MITALNSSNFQEQQENLMRVLEKDYKISIPNVTKEKLLSKCANKNYDRTKL